MNAIKRRCLLLALGLAAGAQSALAAPFFAQHVHQGVTFQVESPNNASINAVLLRAITAAGQFASVSAEADGTLVDIEVDDLDANGYPEIYVFVQSVGSGSYGSLIAYASNRNKSITPIHLPDLSAKQASGYMGHDKFKIGEGKLLRRFPIYLPGDTNSRPTGGMRQIQYRLVAGEAGWLLKLDRAFNLPQSP